MFPNKEGAYFHTPPCIRSKLRGPRSLFISHFSHNSSALLNMNWMMARMDLKTPFSIRTANRPAVCWRNRSPGTSGLLCRYLSCCVLPQTLSGNPYIHIHKSAFLFLLLLPCYPLVCHYVMYYSSLHYYYII